MSSTSHPSTIVGLSKAVGQTAKLLRVLEKDGLTPEALQQPINDPVMRRCLVNFWLNSGRLPSLISDDICSVMDSHQRIREIMGRKFFGLEEWMILYGLNLSKKQLREIAEFPWSEDILNAPCPFYRNKSVKETHFVFWGPDCLLGEPLTILKWQKIHPAGSQPKFSSYASVESIGSAESWYINRKFAKELTCGSRWYLMLLETVPWFDFFRSYREQRIAMLPREYEVPRAIEEVTKAILYHRKSSEQLHLGVSGMCRDATIGSLGLLNGLAIWESQVNYGNSSGNDYLCASRKLPIQITK